MGEILLFSSPFTRPVLSARIVRGDFVPIIYTQLQLNSTGDGGWLVGGGRRWKIPVHSLRTFIPSCLSCLVPCFTRVLLFALGIIHTDDGTRTSSSGSRRIGRPTRDNDKGLYIILSRWQPGKRDTHNTPLTMSGTWAHVTKTTTRPNPTRTIALWLVYTAKSIVKLTLVNNEDYSTRHFLLSMPHGK